MMGRNSGLFQCLHWQSDAITTRLDLIHKNAKIESGFVFAIPGFTDPRIRIRENIYWYRNLWMHDYEADTMTRNSVSSKQCSGSVTIWYGSGSSVIFKQQLTGTVRYGGRRANDIGRWSGRGRDAMQMKEFMLRKQSVLSLFNILLCSASYDSISRYLRDTATAEPVVWLHDWNPSVIYLFSLAGFLVIFRGEKSGSKMFGGKTGSPRITQSFVPSTFCQNASCRL